jgi:hypothetical protein
MTLYVDENGNAGDGTAAAPFKTMDAALSAIRTAYDPAWPNYQQNDNPAQPPRGGPDPGKRDCRHPGNVSQRPVRYYRHRPLQRPSLRHAGGENLR